MRQSPPMNAPTVSPPTAATAPLVTPALPRRLACWLYEGMLLFGVVFIAARLAVFLFTGRAAALMFDPESELSSALAQRFEDEFGIASEHHQLESGQVAGTRKVHTDVSKSGIGSATRGECGYIQV